MQINKKTIICKTLTLIIFKNLIDNLAQNKSHTSHENAHLATFIKNDHRCMKF